MKNNLVNSKEGQNNQCYFIHKQLKYIIVQNVRVCTVQHTVSIQAITDTKSSLRQEKHRQYKVQHNMEARSCNHFCNGKAIRITYSECLSTA
jgi:hypothetical protein